MYCTVIQCSGNISKDNIWDLNRKIVEIFQRLHYTVLEDRKTKKEKGGKIELKLRNVWSCNSEIILTCNCLADCLCLCVSVCVCACVHIYSRRKIIWRFT